MKNIKILAIVIAILIIAISTIFLLSFKFSKSEPNNQRKICTMDTKICSDGSSVNRTGPNCEFTSCPENKKSECTKNTDCILTYTGNSSCGPCNADINDVDFKCVTPKQAQEIEKTRLKGKPLVLCERCYDWKINFNCGCQESLCTKIPADEATDWQTYKNDEYGFEIKYPNNYSIFQDLDKKNEKTIPVNSSSKKIYITDKLDMFFCCEPTYFSIEILDDRITDFEKWIIDKKIITDDNSHDLIEKSNINFAGEQAYQIKAKCGITSPGNIILVNHNSKTYRIRYDSEDCLPLAEEILSKFKFSSTTTDETSNWQTYKNNEYGFEFKYPKILNSFGLKIDAETSENNHFVKFSLPTKESDSEYNDIFNIVIMNKESWKICGVDCMRIIKLGENNKYVFGYTGPMDYASDINKILLDNNLLELENFCINFKSI